MNNYNYQHKSPRTRAREFVKVLGLAFLAVVLADAIAVLLMVYQLQTGRSSVSSNSFWNSQIAVMVQHLPSHD